MTFYPYTYSLYNEDDQYIGRYGIVGDGKVWLNLHDNDSPTIHDVWFDSEREMYDWLHRMGVVDVGVGL